MSNPTKPDQNPDSSRSTNNPKPGNPSPTTDQHGRPLRPGESAEEAAERNRQEERRQRDGTQGIPKNTNLPERNDRESKATDQDTPENPEPKTRRSE